MNNEWDDYADNWNHDPMVQAYAEKAYSSLIEAINIDGLTVLDFGCGTGSLTQLISPKVSNILAIDPSSSMIKHLDNKALANVTTVADYLSEKLISKRPEFNEKFDLIIASSVCSFLPDYEATLGLLKSLLKKNSTFIQWDWLSVKTVTEGGLSKARVKKAFQANNFINTKISSPFYIKTDTDKKSVLMAIGKSS